MRWYISKERDTTLQEMQERTKYHECIAKRDLFLIDETKKHYVLDDGKLGKKDNRCMIIGHTDDAFDVISSIKKQNTKKKYKFYLCVCAMTRKYVDDLRRLAIGDDLYIAKQKSVGIIGIGIIAGCEFLDKTNTRKFQATRTEMKMYNLKCNFSDKLEQSFIKFKG